MDAIIFDMDGLLVDSEPCWQSAGKETLLQWGQILSMEQYHQTTGLRTEEWIEHWFLHFGINYEHKQDAVKTIIQKAVEKIDKEAVLMPGAEAILERMQSRYKVGLATSSPMVLVDVVLRKFNLKKPVDVICSAELLPYGKPHPQVYLNCAEQLGVSPLRCLAFEDSYNGMIAAKAARMKCVVVPAKDDYDAPKWLAADLKLRSLEEYSVEFF